MNNESKTRALGKFTMTCLDSQGAIKWVAEENNLVVNVGLQYMCGVALTTTTQEVQWYVGLYGAGASNAPATTDTLALHPGWTEITPYSGTRPPAIFAPATDANPSVATTAISPASYVMNATATVGGAFLCNVSSGTSGILFSAADFSSPGDRVVASGDTLIVTYALSLAS